MRNITSKLKEWGKFMLKITKSRWKKIAEEGEMQANCITTASRPLHRVAAELDHWKGT